MAIFGKDPDAVSRARSTLRNLAHLEPDIVMPQFLERAYAGLEAVNEVCGLSLNYLRLIYFTDPSNHRRACLPS